VPDVKDDSPADAAPERIATLADRLTLDVDAIDRELTEIEMLVAQARTEAERHEAKRVQILDKIEQGTNLPLLDVAALNSQLVTLTRRASVMESQVEVLEGKRKTLIRFRDRLAELGARPWQVELLAAGLTLALAEQPPAEAQPATD
jgi:hypothetical protein